jgi:hypothetical protein
MLRESASEPSGGSIAAEGAIRPESLRLPIPQHELKAFHKKLSAQHSGETRDLIK